MKCPVCKKQMIRTFGDSTLEGDAISDGYKCEHGHYEFSEIKGRNGGFYVKVGKHEIRDLYAYSVRKCRLQNKVIENWIKRESKKFK